MKIIFSGYCIYLMTIPAPVALTQTLKPRFFKHKAKAQLEKITPLLEKLLKQCCVCYIIQAELTDKCNIHYHGTITFISENHKMAYIDQVRDLGFCLIKNIDNIEKWTEYYKKDTKRTMDILDVSLQQIRKEYKKDLIKLQEELNSIALLNAPTAERFEDYLLRVFDEHYKPVYDMDISANEYITIKSIRKLIKENVQKCLTNSVSIFIQEYQGIAYMLHKGTNEEFYHLLSHNINLNSSYIELIPKTKYDRETTNPA